MSPNPRGKDRDNDSAASIREYVEREFDNDEAALVVVASLVVGPSIRRIAALLDLPYETVREYAINLRHGGIWRGSRILADNADGPDGIEIALWVNVAKGYMMLVQADA